MLHPLTLGILILVVYRSMDFHPAVFPEVQRCGIAVSTGQRSSECKSLGDDKREEK